MVFNLYALELNRLSLKLIKTLTICVNTLDESTKVYDVLY